ncbi:DUF4199 domain-containing protein [Hyphobacterium sp. CCMP332]|nr:DUF4199 domain-containing protein [Hyphobacterium sp. CCMP332]
MLKKYAIELKWGIIFFAVTILWMVLEKVSGLHGDLISEHPIYTNLFAIPAIIIYVLALKEKRDRSLNGKMTWVEGLITGTIISGIVAALSPLAQLIIHLYLSPEYFENAINYAIENGKMSEEDAEGYFNLRSYIWQSVGGAMVMGVITSAIVAAFLKKKSD